MLDTNNALLCTVCEEVQQTVVEYVTKNFDVWYIRNAVLELFAKDCYKREFRVWSGEVVDGYYVATICNTSFIPQTEVRVLMPNYKRPIW